MPNRVTVDVWLVDLESETCWLPPTTAESERASRFISANLQRRYLRSHAAVRAILGNYTTLPLDFGAGEHGKPFLPNDPGLQFNLSHSHERALVAVSRDVELGVDIEHFRPLRECLAIAERFFPPIKAAALADTPEETREAEFFRMWTAIEAKLKALGVGLYGAGTEPEGDWSVLPVEVGAGYTASLAACASGLSMTVRPFAG